MVSAPVQSALPAGQSWLDILVGSGVREQTLREQDTLAGRELQRSGLSGYVTSPSGGYMNTLSRDSFDATLAEADRGYALDVARYGLAQADLNYRQRATEAQDRMQQMALQVSQRGPTNAIGYNYLLNNRNAPAGTEKPYGGANISQQANIAIPTPAPRPASAVPQPAPVRSTGSPGPFTNTGPATPAPVFASDGGSVAPVGGVSPLTRPETPSFVTTPAPSSNWGTAEQWAGMTPEAQQQARYGGGVTGLARGGFLDSLSAQQTATAMVGDSPSGAPTGAEEMATATVTPDGQPRLIVAPMQGSEPNPQSPEFQRGYADAQQGTLDQQAMTDPNYQAGVAAFQSEQGQQQPQGGGQPGMMPGGAPVPAGGGFLDSMSAAQMPQMARGGVMDGIDPRRESGPGGPRGPLGDTGRGVQPWRVRGWVEGQQARERGESDPGGASGMTAEASAYDEGYRAALEGRGGGERMPQMAPYNGKVFPHYSPMWEPLAPLPEWNPPIDENAMPRMASGGVVNPPSYVGGAGLSGGTANTAYSQQDIANLPVVKQATGQEQTPRFGAFAGDTSIPGTDTKLPSGSEFRIDQYADMLPSSRALLESIVSTPREMGGLGLDFGDYLESSRRAAPIGRRFGPSAYGA